MTKPNDEQQLLACHACSKLEPGKAILVRTLYPVPVCDACGEPIKPSPRAGLSLSDIYNIIVNLTYFQEGHGHVRYVRNDDSAYQIAQAIHNDMPKDSRAGLSLDEFQLSQHIQKELKIEKTAADLIAFHCREFHAQPKDVDANKELVDILKDLLDNLPWGIDDCNKITVYDPSGGSATMGPNMIKGLKTSKNQAKQALKNHLNNREKGE